MANQSMGSAVQKKGVHAFMLTVTSLSLNFGSLFWARVPRILARAILADAWLF